MSRISPLIALVLSLLLLASACGSDEATIAADLESSSQPAEDMDGVDSEGDESSSVEPVGGSGDDAEPVVADELAEGDDSVSVEPVGGSGDDAEPVVVDELAEGDQPMPVEPDGGIGDGAKPLPGAEEPAETGTWHGPEVAETNCPGVEWTRVQASTFSFSVPADFVEEEVQGIDSEVGVWSNGAGIEISYDFGWYSYSIAGAEGAEVEDVDYSGTLGQFAVVRATETTAEPNQVGVYFPEVTLDGEIWNQLGLITIHDDPNDEIIARCIARSITFG